MALSYAGDRPLHVVEDAVLLAVAETHLDESTFPSICLFTVEQVLDPDYWLE